MHITNDFIFYRHRGRADWQTEGRKDWFEGGWVGQLVGGWLGALVGAWMDGWMTGSVGACMDGWRASWLVNILTFHQFRLIPNTGTQDGSWSPGYKHGFSHPIVGPQKSLTLHHRERSLGTCCNLHFNCCNFKTKWSSILITYFANTQTWAWKLLYRGGYEHVHDLIEV